MTIKQLQAQASQTDPQLLVGVSGTGYPVVVFRGSIVFGGTHSTHQVHMYLRGWEASRDQMRREHDAALQRLSDARLAAQAQKNECLRALDVLQSKVERPLNAFDLAELDKIRGRMAARSPQAEL